MDGYNNQLLSRITNANPIYFLAFILFLTALSYSNTLNSPLVLDDRNSFIEANETYIEDFTPASIKKLVSTRFGIKRAIPLLTFALNHKYSQGQAAHYHLTNISIHLLAVIALFIFLRQLANLPNAAKTLTLLPATLFALGISGLWALSPVQTNAVTYLVQRMTSLGALFYLTTLIFYLHARLTGNLYIKVGSFFAAILSLLFAAMSKENTATLPFAVLMLEEMFLSPGLIRRFLKRLSRSAWLVIIVLIIVLLPLGDAPLHKMALDQYQSRHFDLGERLLTEGRVVVWYISLLLLPLPSRMNLDHDFSISQSLFSPATTFLALLALVVLLVMAWRARHSAPLFSFGIFWFFLNLVIESTVVPLELVFEHRLYLPSIGLFIALIALADYALRKLKYSPQIPQPKELFVLLVIILFAGSSLLTTLRNNDWRDELAIYRDCAIKSPDKPRSQVNYGLALARDENYDEAIIALERAIALGTPFQEVYLSAATNIILSLTKQGNNSAALVRGAELFREIPPNTDVLGLPRFLHNLAYIYYVEEDHQMAIEAIKSALSLDIPSDPANTILFATKVLASAYENPSTREALGMDDSVDRQTAVLGRFSLLMLQTRQYSTAGPAINTLVQIAPEYPEAISLQARYADEEKKNQAARELSAIGHHLPYQNDRRYRLGLSAANFILKYYKPLTPFIGKLLAFAAQDQYAHDPFITLAKIKWQFKSMEPDLDTKQLDLALQVSPDFTPLLGYAVEMYKISGRLDEELATAEHILEIYPAHPDWRQLEKRIIKLRNSQRNIGVSIDQ